MTLDLIDHFPSRCNINPMGSYTVTIQQIMAGLDLSSLGIEFLACSKVSFLLFGESFSQVGPVMV